MSEKQEGMDRRTFVKAAAGTAAAVAAGASVAAMEKGLRRTASTPLAYLGARVLPASPAKIGTPLIPLRANSERLVEAVPWNLEVHRAICHSGPLPGPNPSGDDVLRFYFTPQVRRFVEEGHMEPPLFLERHGTPVRVSDVRGLPPNEGFPFAWRAAPGSLDAPDSGALIPGLLLRIDPGRLRGAAADRYLLRDPAAIAFNSFCTHFCCIVGWHQTDMARSFGAWDTLFCICHNARFDPYQIEQYAVPESTPWSAEPLP